MYLTNYNKGKDFWNFDDLFSIFNYKSSTGAVNVSEDDEKYTIEVNIAGMNKEDVDISVDDGYLKIKGHVEEKVEDKDKNYYRSEFKSESFERSFQLPENFSELDEITASAKEGILVIELPKRELPAKEKFKQIEIK